MSDTIKKKQPIFFEFTSLCDTVSKLTETLKDSSIVQLFLQGSIPEAYASLLYNEREYVLSAYLMKKLDGTGVVVDKRYAASIHSPGEKYIFSIELSKKDVDSKVMNTPRSITLYDGRIFVLKGLKRKPAYLDILSDRVSTFDMYLEGGLSK